jgi:hypothetical protein
MKIACSLFVSALLFLQAIGQETIITGKVIDKTTGEGIPFASVFFKNTTVGTSTNFEGQFELKTSHPGDSLIASYIGYKPLAKKIIKGKTQNIAFYLTADVINIEAFTVSAKGENPAWAILRKVIDNKKSNDPRSLNAYQYDSYTKIELDVDNITDKFRKKKPVKKVIAVIDSISKLKGEDGRPIMPVFFSESLSEFYYTTSPERKKEVIKKTKLTGIAVEDGTYVSQLIGTSFQQYNFYQNWLKIVDKDFVSPIADSWRAFYEYELVNVAELVGNNLCYRISFKPKNPEDLAFTGTIWIADSSYAIKQIDVKIDKTANLNFIEKIVLQQEYENVVTGGAWLPSKSRIVIDVGEIRDDWAGMLAKFYVSNRNFIINEPKDAKFYEEPVTVDEQAMLKDEKFWEENRPDSLTQYDKVVYNLIDTINNLPVVRTYVEIADIVINGYKRIGKFDVGPYPYLYAWNRIEGHRFQMGFKTNYKFSRSATLKGYLAYGTLDERLKYSVGADYIFNRRKWLVGGVERKEDIDRVGIWRSDLDEKNTLFIASNRWGNVSNPYWHTLTKAYLQMDIVKGFTSKISFRNRNFDPLYNFEYFKPSTIESGLYETARTFTTSEIELEFRIAFKEKLLQNDNARVSFGTGQYPIITLRFSEGLKGLFNSNISLRKYMLLIEQNVRVGIFGRTQYELETAFIPSSVPYPLLENHLGNITPFYNTKSFNQMDISEFVSDKYVSLRLTHKFDGLISNRIPLIKKLDWRFFATSNILYGSISQSNLALVPLYDSNGFPLKTNKLGEPTPIFKSLHDLPYIELGYGVSNILRFVRIDFVHRVTHLGNGARPFGVKISTKFEL